MKKYELIASHTDRHSFAINMYLTGIATTKIMLLTGHVTEEAFFSYIRIGKVENTLGWGSMFFSLEALKGWFNHHHPANQ